MTPMNVTDFDSFGWVQHYFPHLDRAQMDAILSFSLIWNLFEARICDKFASTRNIRNRVDRADRSGILVRDNYEQYLNYFRKRYGPVGAGALDELAPTNPGQNRIVREANARVREEIERVFQDPNPSTADAVNALLLIAYRVRNNFFHGSKNMQNLHRQAELFRVINKLLSTFIEAVNPPPR
jgi:hypothetical protein